MSKAKLKKHLLSLTKEQITDIVLELYDARKEAKDYLEFYLAPDCNAELEKSKKAIRNEFFPTRGFSEKPSLDWRLASQPLLAFLLQCFP